MEKNNYRLQRGSVERIDRHRVHQSVVRKQMVDVAKNQIDKKKEKDKYNTSAESEATERVESASKNTAYYAQQSAKEHLKAEIKNRRTMGKYSKGKDPSFFHAGKESIRNARAAQKAAGKQSMKRYVVNKEIEKLTGGTSIKAGMNSLKQLAAKSVAVIKKAVMNPMISLGGAGLVSLILVLSLFMGTFSVLAYEPYVVPSYMSLSEEVLAYQETIERYCNEYHIGEYVYVVMAIMMQESGGRGNDPMQCSESGYNTEYPRVPNGITDPEYSVKIGVKTYASCVQEAGLESPNDTEKLSLSLQAYNYGNGYISWAIQNFGGYTKSNARTFSDMKKQELGTSGYGDPEYVDHVLRYIAFGFGELRSQPNFNNSEAWGYNNVYTARWMGQCTWFAWGRFYEVYGYSPGFTQAGYQCVGELLSAHGDKFSYSTEPAVGAIFSYNAANNHTGFVVAVEGNNVTVQEGNIQSDYHLGGNFPGVAWNYPFDVSRSSTPFGWWEKTYTKSDMASRGVSYAVPKTPVGLPSSTSSSSPVIRPTSSSSNNTIPSIDYLAELANKKYGMSRENVVDALKLCTNEGMTASDILPYYMACTTINHYIAYPEKNLLRNWGGGAAQRYYDKLNPKPESYIQDFAKKNFYKALVKLDKRAWDIHGQIPENRVQCGGFAGTQHLDEAFYYELTDVWGAHGKFTGYIAVWDRDAKWYP